MEFEHLSLTDQLFTIHYSLFTVHRPLTTENTAHSTDARVCNTVLEKWVVQCKISQL